MMTILLSSLIWFNPGAQACDNKDPEVVAAVDLQQYSGLWYEIAHSPNFFQKDCVRSTAEYKVLDAQKVSVKNVCFKADGDTSDISGKAKVVNPEVPAKLKVRFNWFARGDYWIVDLDPDYQWAVVSGPKKKNTFILARQAPMEPDLLNKILNSLKARGFDTDSLIFDKY
jgi:apolipoprotein D and lipocalin family protein